MKTKQIAALLRDDLTTIGVTFTREDDDEGIPQRSKPMIRRSTDASGRYTFKVLREDAATLAVGDSVVVETRHGLAIGCVAEVHTEPQIDPDSDITYKWFVTKIDLQRYQQIIEHERGLEKAVLEAERTVKRRSIVDQFREALGGKLPDTAFHALAAPAAPQAGFVEPGAVDAGRRRPPMPTPLPGIFEEGQH